MSPERRSPLRLVGPPIAALITLALFVAGLGGTAGTWSARAFGSVTKHANKSVSPRDLAYQYSRESMRTTQRYEQYRAGLDDSVVSRYVMGSSELWNPAPQSPANFLRNNISDADLFLSGRGFVQTLPHAIELAAIAPKLRNKQVVLILSAQWFTREGITPQTMREVYSPSLVRAMLDNPDLSSELKARLSARVTQLLGSEWLGNSATLATPTDPTTWLPAAQGSLTLAGRSLRTEVAAARAIPPVSTDRPTTSPQAVPLASFDWDAAYRQAAADSNAATNNEFRVEDDYYRTNIAPDKAGKAGMLAGVDYGGESPEYGDLDLFLQVAKDLRIDVMLVSVPMNGPWYDYVGYPKERRAAYYAKVRSVAATNAVRLADFADQEYTPGFLYDIMHLGWKGWLDVTKASLEFRSTP